MLQHLTNSDLPWPQRASFIENHFLIFLISLADSSLGTHTQTTHTHTHTLLQCSFSFSQSANWFANRNKNKTAHKLSQAKCSKLWLPRFAHRIHPPSPRCKRPPALTAAGSMPRCCNENKKRFASFLLRIKVCCENFFP